MGLLAPTPIFQVVLTRYDNDAVAFEANCFDRSLPTSEARLLAARAVVQAALAHLPGPAEAPALRSLWPHE